MFILICTTLTLMQLAHTYNMQVTGNVQVTGNPPQAYFCDDDQIKELVHDLKFVKLMNENMQLKIDALSLSIKQQFEEHEEQKTLRATIDVQKATATASNAANISNTQHDDIALKLKQIEMMNQNIQSKLEASDISINKQFQELKKAIAAIVVSKDEHKLCNCNSTLRDLSTTSTASSGVIPKFCQNGRTGIQTIQIANSKLSPFKVNCIQDSKQGDDPWILIQRRRDGSVDFYRSWYDYQNGFGNLDGEFFIGLDKLHALTQSALYELWIQFEDFSNETRWAKYSRISIGDENQSYALNTLGNFTGNAGDSLLEHVGSKFTTKDKDNDGKLYDNCAQLFLGAWWYYECYKSNLNGKYFSGTCSDQQEFKGVVWSSWHAGYSLKHVHMAIRPVKWN